MYKYIAQKEMTFFSVDQNLKFIEDKLIELNIIFTSILLKLKYEIILVYF